VAQAAAAQPVLPAEPRVERTAEPVTPPTEPVAATPEPAVRTLQVAARGGNSSAPAVAAGPAEPAASEPATAQPLPSVPPEYAEPAEVAPAPPFNINLAKEALAAAAAEARSCGNAGTDAEYVRVAVTFAPSGKATVAVVEGDSPVRGTPAGSCVAVTMRKAVVPPFSGDRVTVRQTISLTGG
jgi:hypothetical protein